MAHESPCVTGPAREGRTEPGKKSVCPSRVLAPVLSRTATREPSTPPPPHQQRSLTRFHRAQSPSSRVT